MVACDVQRLRRSPSSRLWEDRSTSPYFTIPENKDVQDIGEKAIEEAKHGSYNPVILDTAGRLQIDTELMAELPDSRSIVSRKKSYWWSTR